MFERVDGRIEAVRAPARSIVDKIDLMSERSSAANAQPPAGSSSSNAASANTQSSKAIDSIGNVERISTIDHAAAYRSRFRLFPCCPSSPAVYDWTVPVDLAIVSGPCNSFYCLGQFKNVYDDDDDGLHNRLHITVKVTKKQFGEKFHHFCIVLYNT